MKLQSRIIQFACAVILLAGAGRADALNCAQIGGMDDGNGNCVVGGVFDCTVNTTIDIPGDLTVNGAIDCDGGGATQCNNVTVNVGGDLIVSGLGSITANGASGPGGITPGFGNVAALLTVIAPVAVTAKCPSLPATIS